MGESGRTRRRRVAGSGCGATSVRETRPPLAVQLLPEFLVAGELPRVAVGGLIEAAPAVYAGVLEPWRAGGDRWRTDEFGCVEARGAIVPAMLDPGGCACRVDVLDAAGRLFPLNAAATGAVEGRVRVRGALYLDPELAPGTEHGEAVSLCRRRYRLRALRRYRRTAGAPVAPRSLDAVPRPDETAADAVYVAELEPLDRAGAEAVTGP